VEVRDAGAHGYVSKSQATRDLVLAIQTLLAGETFFGTPSEPLSGGKRKSRPRRNISHLALMAWQASLSLGLALASNSLFFFYSNVMLTHATDRLPDTTYSLPRFLYSILQNPRCLTPLLSISALHSFSFFFPLKPVSPAFANSYAKRPSLVHPLASAK